MALIVAFVALSTFLFGPPPRTLVTVAPRVTSIEPVGAVRLEMPCDRAVRLDLYVRGAGDVVLRTSAGDIPGRRLQSGWTGFLLTPGPRPLDAVVAGDGHLVGFDGTRPSHRVMCSGDVDRGALALSTSWRFARNHPLGPLGPAVAGAVCAAAIGVACVLAALWRRS